jgi:hypothetical protein
VTVNDHWTTRDGVGDSRLFHVNVPCGAHRRIPEKFSGDEDIVHGVFFSSFVHEDSSGIAHETGALREIFSSEIQPSHKQVLMLKDGAGEATPQSMIVTAQEGAVEG